MADRLDVAGRLAEGLPAVQHTQSYVRASQLVGYLHPDLTAHTTQVRDWYDGEDGLDLHALDADCAQLRAAENLVTEALRLQRAQLAALATAWAGPGADAAVDFVQRHCDTATAVVAEVRAAAQRCESLRDHLWQLVDAKVATAIAIDDRALAQRPTWLAAATALTAGEPTAREVVEQQVAPYVADVIGTDWLAAMRATRAAVAATYDTTTDRLAAAAPPQFEVPEDFGPAVPSPGAVAPGAVAPSAPLAAASIAPFRAATAGGNAPAASAPLLSNPPVGQPDWGPAPGNAAGLSSGTGLGSGGAGLGGGVPGGGAFGCGGGLGTLGALASRIIQEMGGLLGSAGEQLGDSPTHAGSADLEDRFDEAHRKHDRDEMADPKTPRSGDGAAPAGNSPPAGNPPLADAVTTAPPVAAPSGGAPSSGAPPVAAPSSGAPPGAAPPASPPPGSTPCEIAANELPQAGQ